MGLFWLLFKGKGLGVDELARRVGIPSDLLKAIKPRYREFNIPKRTGGERVIHEPEPNLKEIQRLILRRVLGRLRAHDAAHAFERGKSIATHARIHAGRAVILRMDIQDFFPSIGSKRIKNYFRAIGWNREATALLTKLCVHNGGLPQGAPTSPRLSNIVNHRLDARLAGQARAAGAAYSRYADDLTFSFEKDEPGTVAKMLRLAAWTLREEGYRPHGEEKTRVLRQHQRQKVTGLVVNAGVNLPRETRRKLRAVEHRLRNGKRATMTEQQLAGWMALRRMVEKQGRAES